MPTILRWVEFAAGLPYHAALVPVSGSRRDRPEPHTHADFHELVFVTAGEGTQRVGDTEMPLRAGDVVLVRPHDRHEFAATTARGMRFVNIAFPSERWRAFADLAGLAGTVDWDRRELPPAARADLDGPVAAEFARVLGAGSGVPRVLDLVRLWTAVVPMLERADGTAVDRRPGWLVSACVAMSSEENLREGLPRLLALAAVSSGHLARSMRTHYGCTPVAFVARRRLEHAALLLTTTTEGIGRIAQRCGFSGQSYFGRLFQQKYGMAPRDYREATRRAVVPAAMDTQDIK
ncbi:helix-turn-helix domain-containing protein [Nonomuraea turkmeniaca]|uniref:Helix-turn-helix domain-containing protein n=1 Tax=Nonomuraea turkmeniaca TaxID=103838 RepID=A0A5S4FYU2_9ACTN|nr:AraC family transcriptional regulator [Nonomuraea turkmeniaca]TMR25281.1 helix-turn-helix domain-containing protein [Nonomuraea turkmeniaca]